MKTNVLVFPCGSEIGLEVNRALTASRQFALYGANSVDDHGRYAYKNYIPRLPHIDAPDFLGGLNAAVGRFRIDYIVPAHDRVVVKLAGHQEAVAAPVVTSCAETCRICASKAETYNLLKHVIRTPNVFTSLEEASYPLFVKPDVGQGSKGTHIAYTKEQAEFYFANDPTLLALEYLPGREFTVDCFTDRNGTLLFSEGRERVRISNGISVHSTQVRDPRFRETADRINAALRLRGVWFYQAKESADGELVLMEIAPRVAGTMGLMRADGVNLIELSLLDRMGIDVSIMHNGFVTDVDRALASRYTIRRDYSCLYIDYATAVVVDDCVQTDTMKLLYQAKNRGKRIVLFANASRDIREDLRRHAISERLFDGIVPLAADEPISAHLTEPDSIFVADSFTARKEVFTRTNIPVFALSAVESLLE